MKYQRLFEPIRIRGTDLKNRIIMPAIGTGFGIRNEIARSFYTERARGGVGTIILCAIQADLFAREDFVEGLGTWLVNPIHEYGAKVGPQIWYGNQYPSIRVKGATQEWVAPSPGLPVAVRGLLHWYYQAKDAHCRELTVPEIDEIISRWAMAAARAREAGCDLIEVHGAHGHNLAEQFFSPLDNRRSDKYGGDLAGRMRFSIRLARAIREAVGDDFPVFWRLSAEEEWPGGIKLEESLELASELVKAGVDVIDVSYAGEVAHDPARTGAYPVAPGPEYPMGTFAHLAEEFKKRVQAPVVTVGRINKPEVAEAILADGKADLIAIARQLIADPLWPEKAAAGNLDDITPCIGCNYCLDRLTHEAKSMACAVNASVGKGEEFRIAPAKEAKNVLVVGGGPAGMEAARVAALRGHKVTLCEKGEELGGQLLAASVAPDKNVIQELVKYLSTQVHKTGVQVKLNEEVTAGYIGESKPDVVIMATGASPFVPELPGITHENVLSALDVLAGQAKVGNKVIIIGGGNIGCETARFLAEKGKEVTITSRQEQIGHDIAPNHRPRVLEKMRTSGIRMMPEVMPQKLLREGVIVVREGAEEFYETDTVVIAGGMISNGELAKELEGKVPSLYMIGDCAEPRKIVDAIHEGAAIARQI